MADKQTLTAVKRDIFGKKVKQLRKDGKIPANVYGSDVESVPLTVQFEEFRTVYNEAGESTVVNLKIDGEKSVRPVLIREPQLHPITHQILHIDLRQVNLKEKIKTLVDLVQVGESVAKNQGAVIITLKDQVEVEALPGDLPDEIEVDISKLEKPEDTVTVADLKVDRSKVEILLEPEEILVKAEEPKEEAVEEAPAEPEEGEPAAEGEKPQEEAAPQNEATAES